MVNVTEYIAAENEKITKQIKELAANKLISLKVDIASRLDRRILGVNMQIVVGERIITKTLSMKELFVYHTGANLSENIKTILQKYDIKTNQILSITTDNAKNMISAINNLNITNDCNVDDDNCDIFLELNEIKGVRCAAHTLNLAVDDIILKDEQISQKVEMIRAQAKILRKPTQRLSSNMRRPILDVRTRWNSTFDMIVRMKEIDDHMEGSIIDDDLKIFVNEFLTVFEPVKSTTIYLQSSQLNPGDFFKTWMGLKLGIAHMDSELAKSFHRCMERRESLLLENDLVLASLYLDPRFSCLIQNDQHKKDIAIGVLKMVAVKLWNFENRDSPAEDCSSDSFQERISSANQINHNTNDDEESQSLLEIFLLNQFGNNSASSDAVSSASEPVNLLLKELENVLLSKIHKRYPLETNVLQFWNELRFVEGYQFIAKVAQALLAVPMTQASVERNFSALKFILSESRTNLSSNNLENVLMIRLNH